MCVRTGGDGRHANWGQDVGIGPARTDEGEQIGMAEERNVEGVIVGVGGGQWATTALIQTDDGTQVEASFSDMDQELVDPGRFREGTRIRLDVPARYTTLQAEHSYSERPTFYEVPARRPFAVPRQAEWIDGAGQAHPLVRDVGHQAQDIHPGWDQVEGHPIYADPQGPYGHPVATGPTRDREDNWTSIPNETKRESERTMTSVGKKTVQGNLTGGPRQVRTKAGQDLVVFKMAENHRWFNESSRQWQDSDPTFYDVAVDRDRLGANVLSSLHKGDRVTVSGNYQVGAYSTSTGEPGLNHRIWAEDVAASMQYNPVTVLPRDHNRKGASFTQSPGQSVDQGLQPEKMTPESFTSWAAQNPVKVPGAQQGAGVSR